MRFFYLLIQTTEFDAILSSYLFFTISPSAEEEGHQSPSVLLDDSLLNSSNAFFFLALLLAPGFPTINITPMTLSMKTFWNAKSIKLHFYFSSFKRTNWVFPVSPWALATSAELPVLAASPLTTVALQPKLYQTEMHPTNPDMPVILEWMLWVSENACSFKHLQLNTSSSLLSAGASPRAKTTEQNLPMFILKTHWANLRPCILLIIMIVTLFTCVFCRQIYSVFPKIMDSVFLTSLLPCEMFGTYHMLHLWRMK